MKKTIDVNKVVEKQLRRANMMAEERRTRQLQLRQAGGQVPRVLHSRRCSETSHPLRCRVVTFSNQVVRHIEKAGAR